MKRTLEKISVLSLSLLLISTYAVSAALPAMLEHFSGRTRTEVEQLVPITSFAIMLVILLNGWMSKILTERLSIILGLLLIAAAGSIPVFVQQYEVMFAARILLGVGIGLVNFHAVNMISERYEGNERATLLGYRNAAEMLGNAALTLVAGQLMGFGWRYAFLVYLAALPILALYLLFVPKQKERREATGQGGKLCSHQNEADAGRSGKSCGKATGKNAGRKKQPAAAAGEGGARQHLGFLALSVILGAMMICMNSSNTLRIPALTLERGLGTEAQASVILSFMMASGIFGAACFGGLVKVLKGRITAASMILYGAGMLIVAVSGNLFVLGLGAVIAGAAQNLMGTALFNNVSEKLPAGLVHLGTTCVLVGCNLGSSCSPVVLKLIGFFSEKMGTSFVVYAVVMLVLGAVTLFSPERKKTAAGTR